jgi:hypothetical protein
VLGIQKARNKFNEAITTPVTSAVVMAAFALVVALVAILMGAISLAH